MTNIDCIKIFGNNYTLKQENATRFTSIKTPENQIYFVYFVDEVNTNLLVYRGDNIDVGADTVIERISLYARKYPEFFSLKNSIIVFQDTWEGDKIISLTLRKGYYRPKNYRHKNYSEWYNESISELSHLSVVEHNI